MKPELSKPARVACGVPVRASVETQNLASLRRHYKQGPAAQNKANSGSRDCFPRLREGRLCYAPRNDGGRQRGAAQNKANLSCRPCRVAGGASRETPDGVTTSRACRPGAGVCRAKQSQFSEPVRRESRTHYVKQSQFGEPGLPRRWATRNDRNRGCCAKQSQLPGS